jgi:hypothetical protein
MFLFSLLNQIIYLIGWAPDVSQPKPLPRGSATEHLGDLESMLQAPDMALTAPDAALTPTSSTTAEPVKKE